MLSINMLYVFQEASATICLFVYAWGELRNLLRSRAYIATSVMSFVSARVFVLTAFLVSSSEGGPPTGDWAAQGWDAWPLDLPP